MIISSTETNIFYLFSTKNIDPPNASTIFLQVDRPRPTPEVLLFAVASIFPSTLNIYYLSSSLIPIPESRTINYNTGVLSFLNPISARRLINPWKVNFNEFPMRLINIYLTR